MTNGSYTSWGEPLRFTLGGFWYGLSEGVANGAGFWSSVVTSDGWAYHLDISVDNGYVEPSNYTDANASGLSVRCVAR